MPFNQQSDTGYFPMSQEDIAKEDPLINAQKQGAYIDKNFVQGYLASQENKRANQDDARKERVLGMQEEAFGFQREDRQKEAILQAGMRDAAKENGYQGVINYLETADPERALKFTQAKLDLDDHILKNSVLQSTSEFEKNRAMIESYGLLGRMGAQLLQAPQQARADMYQQMLPMVKAVNPAAPETLNDSAVNMFMLATAQAMPQSQALTQSNNVLTSQSQLGKIDMDIRSRLAAGVDADDPGLQSLMAERDRATARTGQALAQLANAQVGLISKQQSMEQQQMQANEAVNKNLQAASKDWVNFIPSYTAVKGALTQLSADPNNAALQNAVGRSFVKAFNSGAMSDADAAIAFTAAGVPALWKKVQSTISGQVVSYNAQEIKNIDDAFNALKNSKLEYQKSIESGFENSMSSRGSLIDWNAIRKPSSSFDSYSAALADKQNGGVPPALQAQAERAIQAGADPRAVQARLQQIMAQRGAQ